MQKLVKKLCFILLFFVCIFRADFRAIAEEAHSYIELHGKGTKDSPYEIASYEDLVAFRDCVNLGNAFENQYFVQTKDIVFPDENWIPIGLDTAYFAGVYDGNGHTIENIVSHNDLETVTTVALFGNLGGTIVNLGIESGTFEARFCASFAACITDQRAEILNCYSKADLRGYRVGGIADSFSGGIIVNCVFDGTLSGESMAGIVSYGGDVKVYHCYTTTGEVATADVVSTTSYSGTKENLNSNKFLFLQNISTGIAQCMFAEECGVELMQWKHNDRSLITFGNGKGYLFFWNFINLYLLPLCLFIAIGVVWKFFLRGNMEKGGRKYRKLFTGCAVIFGIISFFLLTAVIGKGVSYLNLGNVLILIECLGIFAFSFKIAILPRLGEVKRKVRSKHWLFWVLAVIILLMELSQFDLVPKYDACLYYGSMVEGAERFRIDLLTYIGGFVCWKWAHGIALFVAPFEFLFPGQVVGLHIGNMVISFITLWLLWDNLEHMYKSQNQWIIFGTSLLFFFLPYNIGLFSYFNMDWQIQYFAVWLMYFVRKKNNLLIGFCGYLLAFTKITGLVFYVLYLICYALCEILLNKKGKSLFIRIKKWWRWSKVIIWVFPAVLFLVSLLYGDHFTMLNFYGTYVADQMIQPKTGIPLWNTLLQAFIFGFRWLIGILFFAALMLYFLRKRKAFTKKVLIDFMALSVASLGVVVLLCINNGDAECPRYTTILNVFYAMSVPFFLKILCQKGRGRKILLGILCGLFVVQTFWTIDPTIIFLSGNSIDTGKKSIYKLALKPDDRAGMNLGVDFGTGYESMGDTFAYNLEHAYYDGLLEKMLKKIELEEEKTFYVLDVLDYELSMSGSYYRSYKVYWQKDKEKRNYDGSTDEALFLNSISLSLPLMLEIDIGKLWTPDDFYLIVPNRVSELTALNRLNQEGYEVSQQFEVENMYGQMRVYYIQR